MSFHQVLQQLEEAIHSFDRDPADSDYQRGYLAALIETYTRAVGRTPTWVAAIEAKNKEQLQ